MSLARLRLYVTILAFSVPQLLAAQDLLPATDPTYNPREGLIRLDVLVTDQAGRPVSGIAAGDMSLLDAGKPVKTLTFHAYDASSTSMETPVTIILLVDTLNLPERLATYERREVTRFLKQTGGRPAQPVSLFELSSLGVLRIGQPSTNGNLLADEFTHNSNLEWLSRPPDNSFRGGTLESLNPESAIFSALKALGDIAATERQRPGRKLLIWVGPGWGLGTGVYRESLATRQTLFDAITWFSTLLREARMTLYSFSVGETNADGRALLYRDYLDGVGSVAQATFLSLTRKVLAVQSGGRVLEPTADPAGSPVGSLTDFQTNADLVLQINSCVAEASTFYTLSFDPSPADHPDEFHDLKVKVNRPGLIARTTTGYYDQPFYSDYSNPALRPVTVEQLKQILIAAHDQPDTELERQLSGLTLTERLSTAQLSTLADQRSAKVRQTLVVLADASAFLDPPAGEITSDAAPDYPAQQRIRSLALDYLNKAVPQLPNFFASRTIVNYMETPAFEKGDARITYQPLHVDSTEKDTVFYRNGYEVGESAARKRKRKANEPYLLTYGIFGPLLRGTTDAIFLEPGGPSFRRWERSGNKPVAVFDYKVPEEKSSYHIGFCCLPDGEGTRGFRLRVGYHGEVAIDPATGAILRLGLTFDLQSTTPLVQSKIVIEYGPVEIGGQSYICPIRSISISTGRSVVDLPETLHGPNRVSWRQSFKTYGPYATMLNDIRFDAFHLFHADSRLLTGFAPGSEEKP